MDTSKNVSPKDVELCKNFLYTVYKNFQSRQRGIHFGLIECGSGSQVAFKLTNHTISQTLDKDIKRIGIVGGNCSINKALNLTKSQFATEARERKPRVVVVLLSSKSNDGAIPVVDELKDDGVRIMVLGMGSKVDLKQIEGIATSPLYALKVPKFEYLPHMAQTVKTFIDEGRLRLMLLFFLDFEYQFLMSLMVIAVCTNILNLSLAPSSRWYKLWLPNGRSRSPNSPQFRE